MVSSFYLKKVRDPEDIKFSAETDGKISCCRADFFSVTGLIA